MIGIVELFPIGLALIAIFTSSIMYRKTRRKYDKVRTIFGIIAASIMIVAQTSWYTTSVIMDNLEDTVFANTLWTIFNSLTMILIILYSIPRRYTPRDKE